MFLVRVMIVFIIDMHKRSLDITQALKLSLQLLGNVMGHPKRQFFVHYNIDFDIIVLAGMVGTALHHCQQNRRGEKPFWDATYRLDLEDPLIMRHGHIYDFGNELWRRCLADQEPHLLEGVGCP